MVCFFHLIRTIRELRIAHITQFMSKRNWCRSKTLNAIKSNCLIIPFTQLITSRTVPNLIFSYHAMTQMLILLICNLFLLHSTDTPASYNLQLNFTVPHWKLSYRTIPISTKALTHPGTKCWIKPYCFNIWSIYIPDDIMFRRKRRRESLL